ncbi:MAG: hypothetical protein HYR85_04370, partial [Planctomycetes bacterium]|nr:hypothetical protein [Planctomycetota bacterium]
MRPTLRSVAITLFALAAITGSATAQYVDGQWTPGLFPAGQFDGAILAFKSFDDGSGPSLFIGGEFTHAGGIESRRVVRWDGHAFWPVGSGVDDGFVTSLAVFDDGTGPALYAGGAFTHVGGVQILGIARWNGHRWSALEGGYIAGFEALAVFDDGAGEKLYGTGSFTIANGGIANHIARWDGHSWSALADGGTDDHIRLLFPWYRGGQAELYAAGDFNTAGSSGSGSRIARWNGTRWSGTGFGACFRFGTSPIESMRVFDDGTGPALYVAGSFASIPGESVCTESWGVARFDGSAWSPVSGPGWAHALAVYGGGQAAALYASSDDAHYDRSRRHVVRWSGSSWLPLPDGNPFATTTLLAV